MLNKTLLILFLLINLGLQAQTSLKGKIIDASDGEDLIGASLTIQGTTEGTVTDYDGTWVLETDRETPFNLEVAYLGYVTQTINITTSGTVPTIGLESNSINIDIVEVKASRISDETKKSPLTVEALDALAIKETPSQDFYSGLGALKGVDLTTASLGFTVINTRGFNSTSPVRSLQLIDGVDNQSPGLNFSLGNFLGSSELDINKVDLVVGASSAFYGPNAFNGVISMETKNPFFHKGLGVSVKVAERDMYKAELRWADDIKNKNGHSWLAYKLNGSYMQAYDWVADNYDPVYETEGNNVFPDPSTNPGRTNGVNSYGDESSQTFSSLGDQNAGLNSFYRAGYNEVDLVDYNTKNTKLCAAVHIRTAPSKEFESPELILSSNFGSGTTVYQGDNRFSLRGINFYQNRIEYRKKDKWFIRAYSTNEDAANSFDPYFTALKLQELSNTNENWANNYRRYWTGNNLGNIDQRMKDLGYPSNDDTNGQIEWQRQFSDSLTQWHSDAAAFANSGEGSSADGPFLIPGTPEFQEAFDDITSRKNNSTENGTRFSDKSALYHIAGEYMIDVENFKDVRVGASYRMFRPDTEGTIFNDEFEKIKTSEFGFYGGGSKDVGELTLSAAIRVDKNKNFNALLSPAASAVWKPADNTYLRLSFSSAIRNPTLSDQYLNLDVGPAKLLGNLDGFEGLVTIESFEANTMDPNLPYQFIDIAPIQPEKVKTLEVGFRTALAESLFLDGSYYYNIYNDFIGYQIVLDIPFDTINIPGLDPIVNPNLFDTEVYRISANSGETVTTQGLAVGLNYYFYEYYSLSGNYSYNKLNTKVNDDIVPAFNTPEHKYNVSLGARNLPLKKNDILFGFNVNYKWIEGFLFEGSPQFTGLIPSYDMLDAQINFSLPKYHTTIKMGASNVLDNKQFQSYGGPRIGRMAYVTVTYDFKSKI